MKVLLIRPPYSADIRSLAKLADFPLGLAYIAAVLNKSGHQVSVLDALIEGFDTETQLGGHLIRYGLTDNDIRRRIEAFSPDIVGISCLFTTQSDNAHNVCRIVKEVNGRILTVMGGAYPSTMPEEALLDKNLDFVVIGEGEYTMRDLLENIRNNADYHTLDGLAFRQNGRTVVKPKKQFIEDLDSLPFPLRTLFSMEKYFDPVKWQIQPKQIPAATIISSRGCPANCVFCAIHTVWGRPFRARSAENVLTEIAELVKTYGIREVQFQDDNLTLNKKRLLEICDGIKARFPGMKWLAAGTAMWALDEEMITRMHDSGCYRFYLPIESGDQHVLTHIIKKPLILEKIPPLVEKMREIGIEVHGFFIIGLPGETPETVERTLHYARELNLDAEYIYYATPYPGTELYEICRKNNYIIDELNFKMLEPRRVHISTPALPAATLRRLLRKHNIIRQWRRLWRNPVRESQLVIQKLLRDLKHQ